MNQIHLPDEPTFAAVVGIDWGDKNHAWSLQPVGSDQRERGEIEHTPEAVESWASMLSARFHGQPIAVARSSHAVPWYSCSPSMHTCICIRSIHVPLRSFALRCILPAPRMIP